MVGTPIAGWLTWGHPPILGNLQICLSCFDPRSQPSSPFLAKIQRELHSASRLFWSFVQGKQTTRISGFTSLGNPRNDPTSRLQQNKQLWTPVRITPSLSVTSKALQVKPWTNPPRAFQIAWLVPKLPSLKLLKHWPQKGPVSYAHRSIIPPRIPPVPVPGFFLNFSLPIGPPSSAHFTSGPGEEQGSRHCQS